MANKVTPKDNSYCLQCEWYDPDGNVCPAYKDGIPNRFLTGGDRHDTVQSDQEFTVVFTRKLPEY